MSACTCELGDFDPGYHLFTCPLSGEDWEEERMTTFDQVEAAKTLRNIAGTLPDGDSVTLAQTIADYIESTAPYTGPDARRFFAEIAMAYLEGVRDAGRLSYPQVTMALRKAGLSI